MRIIIELLLVTNFLGMLNIRNLFPIFVICKQGSSISAYLSLPSLNFLSLSHTEIDMFSSRFYKFLVRNGLIQKSFDLLSIIRYLALFQEVLQLEDERSHEFRKSYLIAIISYIRKNSTIDFFY